MYIGAVCAAHVGESAKDFPALGEQTRKLLFDASKESIVPSLLEQLEGWIAQDHNKHTLIHKVLHDANPPPSFWKKPFHNIWYHIKSQKRGFNIIETIMVVFLFTIIMFAVTNSITYFYKYNRFLCKVHNRTFLIKLKFIKFA